jgi:serine/threonine protein kinase
MISLSDAVIIKTFNNSGQKQVFLVDIDFLNMKSVILKTGVAPSLVALQRIIREVEIQRTLKSKYFPRNYDFEYSDDGKFIILEEYIEAPQLRECMALFDSEDKIVKFMIDVITGCVELWDQRVVHRDLKPENILVRNGTPVILDLGIARALDQTPLTDSRFMHGPCTKIYAAPEQLTNLRSHIDFRTDLFQIGILIAELFLGIHPFHPSAVGSGMNIVENILSNSYTLEYRGRRMSPRLQVVVKRLLQPMPYNRYRKYDQCIRELGG